MVWPACRQDHFWRKRINLNREACPDSIKNLRQGPRSCCGPDRLPRVDGEFGSAGVALGSDAGCTTR